MSTIKPSNRPRKLQKPLAGLLTAWLLWSACGVYAAPAVDLPDAGKALQESKQVEKQLPSRQQPDLTAPEQLPPAASESGLKVLVRGYHITGQDIFSEAQLEALLTSYKDKELTYSQLQQAANTITQHFRKQGYLVAQAYLPAQEMENGIVNISVLVGRYGEIILKNSSAVPDHILRWQLVGITPGKYVQNDQLERAALLASDLSGLTAKLTLAPGKLPGTTDVIVEAQAAPRRMAGSLSVNNWGNRFTGTYQSTAALTLYNPLLAGDNAAMSLSTTGSGQTTGSINWSLPIGEGSSLNLGYSALHYAIGEEYGFLNADGTAYTQHFDWTYALQRSRSSNLNIRLGYESKRLEDLVGFSHATTDKRSHNFSFGLFGDSTDNLGGGGANSYSVSWYRGSLSGSSNNVILPTGDWEKTTVNFYRQQYLADRLTAFVAVSGQLASTNLDTSERFSLGGANAVRAYPSGEASGDEAYLFTGELRWTLPTKSSKTITQLTAFYDAGISHIEKNPAIPAQNRRSIAGAGLGVNYFQPGDYALKVSYAWKLSAESARSDTDKNGRLWIQGVKYF